MKIKSAVAWQLIVSSALGFNPVYAESNPKSRIAVLAIKSPTSNGEITDRATDQVRDRLMDEDSYKVLSKGETRLPSAGEKDDLVSVLNRAKTNYRWLEFDTAKRDLQQKLDQVNKSEMSPEESMQLVPSYLLLSTIYQVSGDEAKAEAVLETVARLSPELSLNEKEYSPRVRELYEQAQAKIKKEKLGSIKVSTSGKAVVYWNGNYKGESPLTLEGVPAGRHYITVIKEGYASQLKAVEVNPGKSVKVSLALEKSAEQGNTSLSVLDISNSEEVVRKGIAAGRRLQADRIVLVGVTEEKTAIVRMINPDQPQATIGRSIPVNSSGEASGKDMKELMAALTDKSDSGTPRTKVARSEADGQRPFWKKPVVWIVGGLVLAGAGTGIGLGLTGGGSSDVTVNVAGKLPALQQ